MNIMRIVICTCLVVYAACQVTPDVHSDEQPETAAKENATTTEEHVTNEATAPSDASATEISSTGSPIPSEEDNASESTTDTEKTTSPAINSTNEYTAGINETLTSPTADTSHDVIITGKLTPPNDGTEGITEGSTDDFNSTTEDLGITTAVTTTVKEEIKTACSSNPCRNGGTCIDDAVVPFLFSCTCSPGYVGIRCGTVDKCVVDEDGQLCKNGACVYSKNGLIRSCMCFSGTYWNEESKECREPDPPCFPNPCMNGGVCAGEDDMVYCECPTGYREKNCSVLYKCGDCKRGICLLDDTRTMKYCKCNEGLYWSEDEQICKDMTSPCDSNPCHNGGKCNVVSDSEYNCTCTMGFSGNTCEITDKCSQDEDCGSGNCVLSDDKKIRSCHCHDGFYLEQSHTCEKITNVCQPNRCLNDGICWALSDSSYNCSCPEGYTGKNCDVRDLCKMDGGDAYCRNGVCGNNYELGVYYCTCENEKYFQYSERKCVELDMCPLVQCSSTQKCVMGNCQCKENYKWNNVTEKCESDYCASKPCPLAEMICKEGTGSTDYKCYCKEGYAFNGTHCNQASCIFPNLNPCNQYCSMKTEEYECSCAKDFKLKEDNHTCVYIGNSTCSNKTCDNGFCVKKDNIEICLCPPGFTEIEGKCTDICTAGHLTPGVCPSEECEATTEGGFRCKCKGNLTLSQDKTTCMARSVCQKKELGWKTCRERNAKCEVDWLATDGFTCHCASGQVLVEGGICRDICSIESNQRQCSIRGATCDLDRKGKMICKCPPYFKANERDGKCTQPAEFSYLMTLPLDKSTYLIRNRKPRSLDPSLNYTKISTDISVTMREMFTSFTQTNILSCKTASGYILCKIELQFTAEAETDLKRLETEDICLTNGNSDKCLLPPSLVLVKYRISEDIHIQRTDPCDEDIRDVVCGSETTCISSLPHKSFNCSCKPGYFARRKNYQFGNTRSFIEMCTDIDECTEGDPCPANSNCENTIGSFACSCKPGFRSIKDVSGINSQRCVEICNPNPCTYGRCSTRGHHEFDCWCDAGYRGAFCNLQDEHFKRARINTIIVGVVLGGILMITFILFAACISKLRKKKSLENSGHMFYNTTEMTERRRGEGGAINNAFRRE